MAKAEDHRLQLRVDERCDSVAGYCAFRIVDELLRVDPAAHVLGLRWNLLLSIAGTIIGLAWFAATQRESCDDAS